MYREVKKLAKDVANHFIQTDSSGKVLKYYTVAQMEYISMCRVLRNGGVGLMGIRCKRIDV